MAKQKLYGNNSEPCCETCALGKRTSDGKTVLCRRVGAVPLYHHCRHFVYDPLRRTPHRDRALETPDAAAFALDELPVEIPAETTVQDADSHAILERLRRYLKESEDPDVTTILALLNENPPSEEAPRELTSEDRKVLEEIEETIADDQQIDPFDNTTDIFEDLERLDIDALSSTHAAFRNPDFELPDENDDEEPLDDPRFTDLAGRLDATATLTLEEDDEEDEDLLGADDLILLSSGALADDPDSEEELVLNPDGSISTKKN